MSSSSKYILAGSLLVLSHVGAIYLGKTNSDTKWEKKLLQQRLKSEEEANKQKKELIKEQEALREKLIKEYENKLYTCTDTVLIKEFNNILEK